MSFKTALLNEKEFITEMKKPHTVMSLSSIAERVPKGKRYAMVYLRKMREIAL